MPPPVRVLLVEDSASDAALVQTHLDALDDDFTVDWVPTLEEGCRRVEGADCALIDLTLADASGARTIEGFTRVAPELPVIVLTGADDADGIEALRLGAQDSLVKDQIETGGLGRAIRHAIERKQAEAKLLAVTAELAERTQQLALSNHAVFDESLTGMVQLDAGGRVLVANRAFAGLAGAPAEQLRGRPITDLFGPMHTDAVVSALADVFELGEPQRLDALLVRVDGGTRLTTLQLSRLTMDASGNPVVLATVHDITAGRSALVRRVHDQKLDELSRLAAGMAHEIRSPLQYLMTSIDFARSAVVDLLDGPTGAADTELRADLDEALAEIAEGAARIDQIVKGMNVLGRQTGNVAEEHDVRDALKFPLAVARGQAPADTEFVVGLGDVPLVRCSLGLIQQVVLNLLVNAVHAIEDRSTDGRAPGRVEVATSYDDDWVMVSVSDNGVGMSADVQARAVEPFFTTKAEGRGTGQGLPLVCDIVQQHHGRVLIDSEPGRGTTVTVALPRRLPA